MPLEISHRETEGGIIVVTLAGKIMLGVESQQIETLVARLIGEGDRNFIFDMAGVNYIDSTGIGRFIACYNKVMQAGGSMALAGATGVVRDGFRVTRLDTVFQFFPDVESARQSLTTKT
jgi:anti-sigma B factor antagonist